MKIQVICEEIREVTRFAEEDMWDANDISYSHDISGIKIYNEKKKNESYDLEVPFIIKPDILYYLVYVSYSTGDSFHRETGRIEYIDLFKTESEARALIRQIHAHDKKYREVKNTGKEKDKNKKLIYKDGSGKKCQVSTWSWQGWFENLEGVEIITVQLQENI